MDQPDRPFTILMADDDADDCLLVQDALRELNHDCRLRFARDGEELLDYLYRRGEFVGNADAPRPDLILLDWKMPRKDGREALQEIKAAPELKSIPVVVLTTSTSEDDVRYAYDSGVNSYLAKPVTFRALVEMMDTLSKYWFELVKLPQTR